MPSSPSWDDLYTTASTQAGHFTTAQAQAAGYSPQLLHKYLANGKVRRIRRGVYRLVHFPPGDDEDLVVLWLWSEQEGVFSHETALARHDLSDALPATAEMTVPRAWQTRRLRVPEGLELHFDDIAEPDRTWHGPVPITTPARTLRDCAQVGVSRELIDQAVAAGGHGGLLTDEDVARVRELLERQS